MSIAGQLDKALPFPLYHQLQSVLKAEIESGRWSADEQLPNENKLIERFGVSKITVRQALRKLADLGYIRREQGRGTFVNPRKLDEGPRELTSFTDEMRRHNLSASSRILSISVMAAEARVAEALRLPEGSPVVVIKRLRLANQEPMGIQTAHLPQALVPGLSSLAENESLYSTLQRQYHLYAARARETYFAAVADAGNAPMLGIPIGTPVFSAERVTLLPDERPFEFVQSVVRGDRYSIVLDLVKITGENSALRLNS